MLAEPFDVEISEHGATQKDGIVGSGGGWERELVAAGSDCGAVVGTRLQALTAAVGKWSLRADGKGGKGV